MSEIAQALQRVGRQDTSGIDRAFADFYPELKRIARARLRTSAMNGQIETTALVHDSYLKLATGPERHFPDRLHFLAYASRTLRSLVVDAVREERTLRRGGDVEVVTLDTVVQEGVAPDADVEKVDAALADLARIDEGLARLVEMRFFAGLTEIEIAEALGSSERSVRREWSKARALLLTLLAK